MSQRTNIYIVDDESLARERIKRLLESENSYAICGEAENGEQAIEGIQKLKPDIVLLDIRMPGMDGLEVASRLSSQAQPPAIIFCTAYDQYAIEAFQHQAIGYLLKPARKEDLIKALSKAHQLNQAQIKQLENATQTSPDAFVANTWQGQEIIPLLDIFAFRADHKYLTVVHRQGETVSDQTLKDLEQRYSDHFIRIHRNSLVNKHQIEKLVKDQEGHHFVKLKAIAEPHAVSRRHVSDIKNFLLEIAQ